MQPALKMRLLAAAMLVPITILGLKPPFGASGYASRGPAVDLVELQPGDVTYHVSGEFLRNGKTAPAPIKTIAVGRPLAVMRHEVTNAEYELCVKAAVCAATEPAASNADLPVVKVSWRDAQAYASWLSRATGEDFRLPTDAEWVFAAHDRFVDDSGTDIYDGSDPGQRALADYDRDTVRQDRFDKTPKSIGSFGANENGLLDVAGNVWEWTDTCYVRSALDAHGTVMSTTVNCGVRVIEGRHRTYMTDFIRDPRAGGCSINVPPSNLGFRLVRGDRPWWLARPVVEWAKALFGYSR